MHGGVPTGARVLRHVHGLREPPRLGRRRGRGIARVGRRGARRLLGRDVRAVRVGLGDVAGGVARAGVVRRDTEGARTDKVTVTATGTTTRFEVTPILWASAMILARPSLAARASWVSPSCLPMAIENCTGMVLIDFATATQSGTVPAKERP